MNKHLQNKIAIAKTKIEGFNTVIEKIKKYALITGRSESLINNYTRKITDLTLHYKKLPHFISEQELRDYLALLINGAKSFSQSEFKHTVYGMRFYFKMLNLPLAVSLPIIKKNKKLPVVLSKQECKLLILNTKNFKHRLMLMLIYGSGLRVSEIINLKWNDLDVNRMMIHIKQAKGKKDRYVPLAVNILNDLVIHLTSVGTNKYIFNGGGAYKKMSPSGIRFLLREAVKRVGINKEGICLHTLRHSYATHLLEDGLDIISIKELLGHSRIETTLVYLHVADFKQRNKLSPLDTLLDTISNSEQKKHIKKINELIVHKHYLSQQPVNQLNLFENENKI